jgi:hypothetical protein
MNNNALVMRILIPNKNKYFIDALKKAGKALPALSSSAMQTLSVRELRELRGNR